MIALYMQDSNLIIDDGMAVGPWLNERSESAGSQSVYFLDLVHLCNKLLLAHHLRRL
jgi:hypothetical protein